MTKLNSHTKRRTITAMAGAMLVLIAGTAAQAMTTLDFNGQAIGPFGLITEQGFDFTFVGFGDPQAVRNIGAGNNALVDSNINNNSGAEVTVSRSGGGLFDLISLDLLNFGNMTTLGTNFRVVVAGVNHSLNPGTTPLMPNLMGISSFNINIVSGGPAMDLGVDNIVVQVPAPPGGAVPEPVTATLGLMGLGVLGMATRRRAV